MNKLLSLEFRNAFKHLYMKLSPLILLAFGIFTGYMNASQITDSSAELAQMAGYGQMDELTQYMTVLSEIVTLLGGMLICKDYTQNTIRNKIIVGHSRTNIYISKQILVTVIYLINIGFFYAGYTISNIMAAGTTHLSGEGFAKVSVFILVSYFNMSLFACFLSMTVKSTLGGALPLLAGYGAMFLSAFAELFRSKILDYVSDTVPLAKLIECTCSDPYPHLLRSCILMTCFGIACFCGGLAIFRKTNLN